MYAVIESSGMQYKVSEGDTVRVPLMNSKTGDNISLDKVMMISGDGNTVVGKPYIDGANVAAEVVGDGKDKKITVFKFKRRVKYRVKTGHRQPFTELKIKSITPGN
ncbi:MAG: 50S ribosomal protein L21 [candidate division Zixibacteria bacterium]|nr:50S ribosomal protein L21 [candidate division Zixibacteria bacterium]